MMGKFLVQRTISPWLKISTIKNQTGKVKSIYFLFLLCIFALLFFIFDLSKAHAGPSSTNYELKTYGFGAGGIASGSSTNYGLFGIAGENEGGQETSTNYKANGGLVFEAQANVPPAPTFTNPSSNYDRLKIVIDTGGNASDAKFAVAISTDDFVTTNYVQSDFTVANTLGLEDWMTYTTWGGASGIYITGLAQNTTYKVKVKARQGFYTESPYGPSASATTSTPSLTFGVDQDAVTFSNLNSGNSYTDSSKTTVLTTSTNAYNGYVVNARITQALTFGSFTIAHYTSPNSAPTTWSGTGFGYTTNDSSLTGGTADRFTNGGPKFAGFTTSSPGDPVADHAGPVLTAISSEQFTITYRVTGDVGTTAGVYTTKVLYIVVPEY